MEAHVIQNMVAVSSIETLPDGVVVATLPCAGHEDWIRLPEAISYGSFNFALSGWNSDQYVAYYRTDKFLSLAAIR